MSTVVKEIPAQVLYNRAVYLMTVDVVTDNPQGAHDLSEMVAKMFGIGVEQVANDIGDAMPGVYMLLKKQKAQEEEEKLAH
jgi:hypothetical protein